MDKFRTLASGEVNIYDESGVMFAKAINAGGDTMAVARRLAASGEMLIHLKHTAAMLERLLSGDTGDDFSRVTMRGHIASIDALAARVEGE